MPLSFGNSCEKIALAVTFFDVQQSSLQKPDLMLCGAGECEGKDGGEKTLRAGNSKYTEG
jgi:hypothetical protein